MSDVAKGPWWWPARDGKSYPPRPAALRIARPPLPPALLTTVRFQKPIKNPTRRPPFWFLLVIALIFAGCSASGAGVDTSFLHSALEKQTIVYSVTSSGTPTSPLITYATLQKGAGQQGLAQVSNVALPWSKTVTVSGQITAFSLSVQNGPGSLTYVVCTITEDGKVLTTNTAKGPFAFASCSAVGDAP